MTFASRHLNGPLPARCAPLARIDCWSNSFSLERHATGSIPRLVDGTTNGTKRQAASSKARNVMRIATTGLSPSTGDN